MIIKKVIKCDICNREVGKSRDLILNSYNGFMLCVKEYDRGKWKRQQVVICGLCIDSVKEKRRKEEEEHRNRVIEWRKFARTFDPFRPRPKDEPDSSEHDTNEDKGE